MHVTNKIQSEKPFTFESAGNAIILLYYTTTTDVIQPDVRGYLDHTTNTWETSENYAFSG